jgi:hypothetical protein
MASVGGLAYTLSPDAHTLDMHGDGERAGQRPLGGRSPEKILRLERPDELKVAASRARPTGYMRPLVRR